MNVVELPRFTNRESRSPAITAHAFDCPLCRDAARHVGAVRGYDLYECASCRHRVFDVPYAADSVARLFGDDYFFGGGSGYVDYLSSAHLVRQGRFYGRKLRRLAGRGLAIDVGAAAGFVAQGLQEMGWGVIGIEPNERMARHARERLGVQVHCGVAESFTPPQRVDAVLMLQIVAHLSDPLAVLRRVRSWLKPGGVLLIETWNHRSVMARLQGTKWHELSPPTVVHLFSRHSLKCALQSAGFTRITTGIHIKNIRADRAAELLRHARGDDSWMAGAVNLLPKEMLLPYLTDDLVWCVAYAA